MSNLFSVLYTLWKNRNIRKIDRIYFDQRTLWKCFDEVGKLATWMDAFKETLMQVDGYLHNAESREAFSERLLPQLMEGYQHVAASLKYIDAHMPEAQRSLAEALRASLQNGKTVSSVMRKDKRLERRLHDETLSLQRYFQRLMAYYRMVRNKKDTDPMPRLALIQYIDSLSSSVDAIKEALSEQLEINSQTLVDLGEGTYSDRWSEIEPMIKAINAIEERLSN